MIRLHGTAVAIGGRGLLLLGPSGSGKSDLALRLIDRGALLAADDQVEVTAEQGAAWARPPARLAGLLEVRGVGIVPLPHAAVSLVLVLDLARVAERMPEPATFDCAGVSLPLIGFDPFTASAAIRAEHALARFARPHAAE